MKACSDFAIRATGRKEKLYKSNIQQTVVYTYKWCYYVFNTLVLQLTWVSLYYVAHINVSSEIFRGVIYFTRYAWGVFTSYRENVLSLGKLAQVRSFSTETINISRLGIPCSYIWILLVTGFYTFKA